MASWRRVAEDSQRQRRDALFDAMAQQVQAAQRRCSALEALSARAVESREAVSQSWWVAQTFCAWARTRGDTAPAAQCTEHIGWAPPREAGTNWTTEASKLPYDDLGLEEDKRLEAKTRKTEKTESHGQKIISRQSSQRRHTHHSHCPPPTFQRSSSAAVLGGSLSVPSVGSLSPRGGATGYPAAVAQSGGGDRAQFRTLAGSMSVPYGGCQSAFELSHGANGQPAFANRSLGEASPRPLSNPPPVASATVAPPFAEAQGGSHCSKPGAARTSRQPLVTRDLGLQAPATETKKALPRGPERFFYDSTTYTGCARFGGPSVVDKENGGAAACRPKGTLPHALAGSPRGVVQGGAASGDSTPAASGVCQAPAATSSTRRRVVLLR